MSPVWLSVLVVGVATVACKATGPVLLGRRVMPSWLAGPVAFLAPVVLAALVVTQRSAATGRSSSTPASQGSAQARPRLRCVRRSWQ